MGGGVQDSFRDMFHNELLSFRQISQILGTWFLYKEEEGDTYSEGPWL